MSGEERWEDLRAFLLQALSAYSERLAIAADREHIRKRRRRADLIRSLEADLRTVRAELQEID